MKKAILIPIILLLLVLPTIASAEGEAVVSLNPASQNVNIGDTFAITLNVSNVVDLDNMYTLINYDATKLNYLNFNLPPDMVSINWDVLADYCDYDQNNNPIPGCIIVMASNLHSTQPINGSANIATLNFTAEAIGVNQFTFTEDSSALYATGSFNAMPTIWHPAAATIAAAPNPAKAITAFNITNPSVTGTINETAHTVALTVPYGTNLAALAPTITITGSSVSPASGVAQNFTSPVTYTVTAADGSSQAYIVTVTAAANPAKAITAFNLTSPLVSGTINETTHTISLTVPNVPNLNLAALVPTITITGTTVSPASGVAQNFAGPLTYIVTAADGTTQTYTVHIGVAAGPSKNITAFNLTSPAVTGTISQTAHTIVLNVPNGTSVTALTPTITITGFSVSPASGVAQDFTSPVIYTVTAADGSTQTYAVTVTVAPKKVINESNLLADGSFEGVIDNSWSIWKVNASSRNYSLARSLSVPFGTGSYSAAISATGAAESRWQAGLVTKASFSAEASADYYLIFYAKANQPTGLTIYLQNSLTYENISPFIVQNVGTDWQRYVIILSSNSTADALLTFTFGDLAAGNQLYLDGLQLFKSGFAVTTTQVKGYIGDKNLAINITNAKNFLAGDVQVELPYYNNLTGQITTKRFSPKEVTSSGVKIDIYNQTFSGIGAVYINGASVGNFNYIVLPKITEIVPSLARADEDLTISGSGFYPVLNLGNIYLVVKTVNVNGTVSDTWIKPHTIDSQLSQITAALPLGVVSGQLYVQTTLLVMDNKEILNKSNSLSYKVMPVIFDVAWSKLGYEQVGDKITVNGKGLGNRPTVNYYDQSGNKLESKPAKLVQSSPDEIIEAESTKKANTFSLTVTSGGVESDITSAINFSASPKITAIASKASRKISSSGSVIQAGKVGEEITITGQGMKADQTGSYIEFQGIGERINLPFEQATFNTGSTSLKVNLPAGAQSGLVNVVVNNKKSNSLPLEIIPTIVSFSPDPLLPGQEMTISANGVGNNINLATVYFTLDNATQITVAPSAITYANNLARVVLKAPLAIANKNTKVSLQYENWKNDSTVSFNVSPTITGASINLDDRVLTIKGYGFSPVVKDNLITYKYADQAKTVINPKVQILGVSQTEEGQEIRIKILDNYYYGYVTVKVGEQTSNEVNFGPVSIKRIARRVEFVSALNQVMGVLYISGYNFGPTGGVKVGENWATVHYRSNFFIIAVIDQNNLYDNPVIVAK